MIKLSDYVIHFLEKTGAKHMFMLPGGGAMHLNDSLGKSKVLQFVPCLHEHAASIAAEAYARINNTIGLVMVTTGPGGTNALTGVAGAYIGSIPVFVISGQVKRADMINGQGIRQQGMQEVDIISIVKPVTKYAALVDNPEDIRYHMERALWEAMHGRKGPVWLDIPLDVQATMIDEDSLRGFTPPQPESYPELESQVLRVIELLNDSKRPVFYAGSGIRHAGAQTEFTDLLPLLNIPVMTTWSGIDLLPEDDKYYYGRPGGWGQRHANFIVQNSDFLLTVGAKLHFMQTGFNHDGFARYAKKIYVDIDKHELHKSNVHPDYPICADAGAFLRCLLAHRHLIKQRDRSAWFEYANRMRERYSLIPSEYKAPSEPVNTFQLIDTISDMLTPEDIYASGCSGSGLEIPMSVLRVKKGQRVISNSTFGSMGYGVPFAIGACLASGGRRTVGINGDGGFVMNVQELETIRRLNLPIKIFVLCNGGYGAIQATQTKLFDSHFVACNPESGLTLPNIGAIATAFGLKTVTIRTNAELREKVAEVLDYDGPVIAEVLTPITVTPSPRQVSYKRQDGQMESLPIEFMSPLLPEDEQRDNMIIPEYKRK